MEAARHEQREAATGGMLWRRDRDLPAGELQRAVGPHRLPHGPSSPRQLAGAGASVPPVSIRAGTVYHGREKDPWMRRSGVAGNDDDDRSSLDYTIDGVLGMLPRGTVRIGLDIDWRWVRDVRGELG